MTCDMEGKRRCYTLDAAFEEFGYLFKPTKASKYGALSLQVRPRRPYSQPLFNCKAWAPHLTPDEVHAGLS